MPVIKLKLSDQETRILDELCDFEDEDREGTLRLCLQYHHAHMRTVATESDEARARRKRNLAPDVDSEVPM